jgi:hypothetical protein
MRARPAGPAQSSVLHDFAWSGPTKEAHPRALDRPDGLLPSVAGQGHARVVPLTLPRGASDQRKQAEAGSHCPSPSEGSIKGGVEGPLKGPVHGAAAVSGIPLGRSEAAFGIARGNSTSETDRGPKSASARPGPSTRPRAADPLTRRENTTRPDKAPASRSYDPGRDAGEPGRPGGRLGGLHLDAGSGRVVPVTRVGRSALRAAPPAGRGRSRTRAVWCAAPRVSSRVGRGTAGRPARRPGAD